MRAPVSHTDDLKPAAGSSAVGAMGKAWVFGGKMPPMSVCGPVKHADYSMTSDQRSFCKQPSAAG